MMCRHYILHNIGIHITTVSDAAWAHGVYALESSSIFKQQGSMKKCVERGRRETREEREGRESTQLTPHPFQATQYCSVIDH